MRLKIVVALAAALTLVVTASGYTLYAARRAAAVDAPASAQSLSLGQLMFQDAATGRVGTVRSGTRTVGTLACDRFYAAGGTAVCLVRERSLLPRSRAVILDRNLREVRRINLAGVPSRARVSASGRIVSWTVFVSGDSYARSGFSTRTSILDTRTGYLITSIEDIPLRLHGRWYRAHDVNYWGVSFAGDDNRFYATVATKGRTYVVEGDLAGWKARAVRENVECPSLSPDGRRLVFKKKVAGQPWRLHVLDLVTMRETALAETASVDDQGAWLDDDTVAYAYPGGAGIWAVPADGSGSPRLIVAGASSPSPVLATARRGVGAW
jgi:dipeptidyl aminopeptidase/acylaminoacyl peptidase